MSLAVVALCGITLASCTHEGRNGARKPTPVLSRPPSTTYPMPPLTGGATTAEMGWVFPGSQRGKIGDYNGKVLVLDFYATWCEPCRESIPHLVSLQQRYGTQGLQIIGLNVGGPDDRLEVSAFAREFAIQYPLAFPDKSLEDLFLSDNSGIPQTFVFDRAGQPLKRFVGYGTSTASELERVIQNGLNSEK